MPFQIYNIAPNNATSAAPAGTLNAPAEPVWKLLATAEVALIVPVPAAVALELVLAWVWVAATLATLATEALAAARSGCAAVQ